MSHGSVLWIDKVIDGENFKEIWVQKNENSSNIIIMLTVVVAFALYNKHCTLTAKHKSKVVTQQNYILTSALIWLEGTSQVHSRGSYDHVNSVHRHPVNVSCL